MRVPVLIAIVLCGCPRDASTPRAARGGDTADASTTTASAGDAGPDATDVDARARDERIARARAFPKPVGPLGHRAYPTHFAVPATIFWVGEPSTKQNGCTANLSSAFDSDWVGAYGGCDAAMHRRHEHDGFDRPKSFVPKENPFYVALPYGGNEDAPWRDEIPWVADRKDATSARDALKNRWVAVRRGLVTCYAQWEDVGPFCVDDAPYVFGGATPRNDGIGCAGERADAGQGNGTASGIDLSPAVASCLGATFEQGLFPVDWWFVDDAFVPEGPWLRVVTSSPVRDGPPPGGKPCFQAPPYPPCE